MSNPIIKSVQAEYLKKDKTPSFQPGDTIKVYCKIFEGDKSRIQIFEGVVTRIKRSGLGELFTVRRVTFGIGVERTFFTHSPLIDSIKLGRKGKVRRAKLYYLRKKSTKDSRIAEKDTKTAEVKAS